MIAIQVHIDRSPNKGWFFAADGCTVGKAVQSIWGNDPTLRGLQPTGFRVKDQEVNKDHILRHEDTLEILTTEA